MSSQSAVRSARAARIELGIGLDSPVPDILSLVDTEAAVPVTVLELPEGIAGMLRRKREGSFIFVSSLDAVERQRFTLAHEFGHHRLGYRSVVDRREDIFGFSRDPREVEANAFAGEFLVPHRAIENWLERHELDPASLETVVRLASFFGVSAQMVRFRLENTRRLTTARGRALDERIKHKEHLALRDDLGLDRFHDQLLEIRARGSLPRLPARIRRGIRAAFQAELVDLPEAARLLRRSILTARRELERDPRSEECLDE
jgi:Zn-dependent peptidase ImmA (M78 family)